MKKLSIHPFKRGLTTPTLLLCGALLCGVATINANTAFAQAQQAEPAPTIAKKNSPSDVEQVTRAPAFVASPEIDDLRRARNELALYHYASRYTFNVVVGIITGGLVMNLAYGGLASTIMGSVGGSLVGIWWFFDQYAAHFLERHNW
ncbi:membrane hypothetical protein [Azospirillaceae bacterium]